MKNKSIVYKRQQKILHQLKENKSVQVESLAEMLGVSRLTIRRDLQYFEDQGIVERFYGGASLKEGALSDDPSFLNGDKTIVAKKKAIAKEAANLLSVGDTVFINSSSTALLTMNYLSNKRLTIVTNNGNSLQVPKDPAIDLILTGGEVHERKKSMVGDFAMSIFSKVTATKCLIGVSGITENGITTSVLQETAINKIMLERCKGPRIVVADGYKIGREHNFLTGEIDLITHLITDTSADKQQIQKLRNCGIEVIIVEAIEEIEI